MAGGILDRDFGGDGIVTTNIAGVDTVSSLQGSITPRLYGNSASGPVIVDYLEDGSLNTSFGQGGIQQLDFAIGSPKISGNLLAGSDGQAVVLQKTQTDLRGNVTETVTREVIPGLNDVAGVVRSNSIYVGATVADDFALIRFTPDGELDTSFGNNGVVRTNLSGTDSVLGISTVTLSGRTAIALAGQAGGQAFGIVIYDTEGNVLRSTATSVAGSDSLVGITQYTSPNSSGGSTRFLAVGTAANDFALALYDSNLELDESFGTAGIVRTNLAANDVARAFAIQKNGKIIVAGDAGVADGNFGLVRYLRDGTVDTTFGNNGTGIVLTNIAGDDSVAGITLTFDQKIYVGGTGGTGIGDFAVARYTADEPSDMRGTGFVINGDTSPGGEVQIDWSIENAGLGSSPFTGFSIEFVLSPDNIFKPFQNTRLRLAERGVSKQFAPGERLDGTTFVTLPEASDPFWAELTMPARLGMNIGRFDLGFESNEDNNSGVGQGIDYAILAEQPVTVPDQTVVEVNGLIEVPVLENDGLTGPSLDPTSVQIASHPANGNVSVDQSTGSITFTPSLDFVGPDQFSYVVSSTDGVDSIETLVSVTTTDPDSQSPWTNVVFSSDANSDGQTSALDALIVVNALNSRNGPFTVPSTRPIDDHFLDTNGDGRVSALDALIVINLLNRFEKDVVTFDDIATGPSSEPIPFHAEHDEDRDPRLQYFESFQPLELHEIASL